MDSGAITLQTGVLGYTALKETRAEGGIQASLMKKILDAEEVLGAEIAAMLLKGVEVDVKA